MTIVVCLSFVHPTIPCGNQNFEKEYCLANSNLSLAHQLLKLKFKILWYGIYCFFVPKADCLTLRHPAQSWDISLRIWVTCLCKFSELIVPTEQENYSTHTWITNMIYASLQGRELALHCFPDLGKYKPSDKNTRNEDEETRLNRVIMREF